MKTKSSVSFLFCRLKFARTYLLVHQRVSRHSPIHTLKLFDSLLLPDQLGSGVHGFDGIIDSVQEFSQNSKHVRDRVVINPIDVHPQDLQYFSSKDFERFIQSVPCQTPIISCPPLSSLFSSGVDSSSSPSSFPPSLGTPWLQRMDNVLNADRMHYSLQQSYPLLLVGTTEKVLTLFSLLVYFDAFVRVSLILLFFSPSPLIIFFFKKTFLFRVSSIISLSAKTKTLVQ